MPKIISSKELLNKKLQDASEINSLIKRINKSKEKFYNYKDQSEMQQVESQIDNL